MVILTLLVEGMMLAYPRPSIREVERLKIPVETMRQK